MNPECADYGDETELQGPQPPTAEIAAGGAWFRLHCPQPYPPEGRGGPRGRITRFSGASRRRLMRKLAQLNRAAFSCLPLMITLTYHNTWPADLRECKAHLERFCKRLRRTYHEFACIWKLEFQRRGAPHFHLLVFNVPWISYLEVAQHWAQVVEPTDSALLRAGTRVERIRSWNGVVSYASKYLGKVGLEECAVSPGRFWGVKFSLNLPTLVLVCAVSWRTFYALRRILWKRAQRRGYPAGRKGRWAGLSAFIGFSDAIRLLYPTSSG
jgi:hypothetical protein